MSIKEFKIQVGKEKKICDLCNAITYEIGSIRITTRDPKRVYRKSNRAIIANYKVKVCEKCFKLIDKKIETLW
jgi:hypothetical protein